jgi:S-DNA-T family DNA segregation ATPase FtsK/SpoIIIE
MGSTQQRRYNNRVNEKKIYIPKTYRKKDIPHNLWSVYRFLYPYIWGIVCLILSITLGWGILAYNPKFPSWSTVTTLHSDITWVDYAINFQTDILLQLIGVGMFIYIGTFAVWGSFLVLRRRISHFKLRVLFVIVASCILSIVSGVFNEQMTKWFSHTAALLPAGFGGAISHIFVHHLSNLSRFLPLFVYYILLGNLVFIGFSLFILSLGFSNQQIRKVINYISTTIIMAIQYTYIAIRFILYALTIMTQRIWQWFHRNKLTYDSTLPKKGIRQEPSFNEDVDENENISFAEETESNPKGIVESFKEKTFKKIEPRKLKHSSGNYQAPSLDLLTPPAPSIKDPSLSRKALEENAERLMQVLNEFGVKGRILGVKPGPVVTLYELEPAAGVKSSRIISLADDIARSMSARSARVSVIPGRNAMGIELPNEHRETVYFREILSSTDYRDNTYQLPLGLGKDIGGYPIITDLAKMPHLLVAGTTGSGKSVGVNAMILSLLFKLSPDECKFIMIDPKMLELSVYDGIPHLLSPVVTEPKKAIVALKWVVQEMESRYRAMAQVGVRNIQGYNDKLRRTIEAGEVLSRRVQTGFDSETGAPIFEDQALDMTLFPYIVVVVDEMADLMLVAGKEIEATVQRLAQMARAAGIHLIMATQRPSVDVITGTIKANFPTRIGFQVTSKIDSRTILGEQGAEQLLGRGDMLYMEPGGRIRRIHGAFVGDEEVERIVTQLKTQQDPNYVDIYSVSDDASGGYNDDFMNMSEGSGDELYDKALSIVLSEGKVSTSFIQRHLSIGYNRAAKIIEHMEKEGVISSPNHVGKREILVPHEKGR